MNTADEKLKKLAKRVSFSFTSDTIKKKILSVYEEVAEDHMSNVQPLDFCGDTSLVDEMLEQYIVERKKMPLLMHAIKSMAIKIVIKKLLDLVQR
ncbi:MAG: hypothetical protein FWE22_03505 [Firmicutes bacterium]|nr:hypothetical protein [Bacillota bacterium]